MAGKGSRQNERPEDQGAKRGRKPSVPPIIDLEATEVEGEDVGAAQSAATATRLESDDEGARADGPEGRGAAASDSASSAAAGWRIRSLLNPFAWIGAMSKLLSLRIRNLRWVRIGAVVTAVIALFAGGIWIGRVFVGTPPQTAAGVAPSEDSNARLAAIEAALRELGETTGQLRSGVAEIEVQMGALAHQMQQTETVAGDALQGMTGMRETLDALMTAPQDGDAESLSRVQLQLNGFGAQLEALGTAVSGLAESSPDAALAQRVEDVAAAVAGLENSLQGAASGVPAGAIEDNTAAIENLAQQFRSGLQDLETRIDARLGVIELAAPGTDAAAPALTVVVARLQQAVDSGGPFGDELDDVEMLAPHFASVAVLRAHAGTGVETRDSIAARYADLEDTIRTGLAEPASPAAEDTGLIADIWARLKGMVDIRRDSEPDRAVLWGHLDTASAHVAAGDLEDAAGALRAITGIADAPIGAWTSAVYERVEADRAVDDILQRSLSEVAAAGDGGGS
jgi:hypothetical protein